MMSDIQTFSKTEEGHHRIPFARPHNHYIGQMRFPCHEGEGGVRAAPCRPRQTGGVSTVRPASQETPVDIVAVAVTTAALTAIIAARYLLVAGAAHALLWLRPPEKIASRRLNRDTPKPATIRNELKLSLLSSWIYALPATLALEAWKHGGTLIYLDVGRYGWPYLFLSAALYLIIQDAWYYWLHRAMHHRWLFATLHAGHHRSRQPTPFASFAFNSGEAALNAWLAPALVFLIPIHPAVLIAILMAMTLTAVLNHSGWEVLPQGFVHGPIGAWLISATHHSVHHTHYDKNFGLHFRLWDRLMGTDVMPAREQSPDAPGAGLKG
jgi:sterol desaturase/sphingolipid hydroxylase (fatty acid hydroxylase superfamily)